MRSDQLIHAVAPVMLAGTTGGTQNEGHSRKSSMKLPAKECPQSNLELDGFDSLYQKSEDGIQLAKVAVGILTLPIAQLSRTDRFKGHLIRKVQTNEHTTEAIEWEVTPDSKLGMPTMLAMRLYFAFGKLAAELKQQTEQRPDWIPIPSWNKLCVMLGISPVQGNRVLLQHHLQVLHATRAWSKCAFKTKKGAQGDSDRFFLVQSIRYKGDLDETGNPSDQIYIRLPKLLLDSIDNDYVKTIDLAFMSQLDNETAQLLYTKISYLLNEARKKGQDYGDFDYQWLAETMGLTVWGEKFRAKEQLSPALQALIQTQYIQKPEWWINGSWKIRIRPGVRFQYGEQYQLNIRKAAIRQQKPKTTNHVPVLESSQEDERTITLIRMATRLNSGRKPDLKALEAHGWTLEDAERKAAEFRTSPNIINSPSATIIGALVNGDSNADN